MVWESLGNLILLSKLRGTGRPAWVGGGGEIGFQGEGAGDGTMVVGGLWCLRIRRVY